MESVERIIGSKGGFKCLRDAKTEKQVGEAFKKIKHYEDDKGFGIAMTRFNKWVIINKNGERTSDKYDNIEIDEKGEIVATSGKTVYYLKTTGEVISVEKESWWRKKYKEYQQNKNKEENEKNTVANSILQRDVNTGRYSIINKKTNEKLIDETFAEIPEHNNGMFIVKNDKSEFKVVNTNGKIISEQLSSNEEAQKVVKNINNRNLKDLKAALIKKENEVYSKGLAVINAIATPGDVSIEKLKAEEAKSKKEKEFIENQITEIENIIKAEEKIKDENFAKLENDDARKEMLKKALTNKKILNNLPQEQKNILLHDLQIEAEKENERVKNFAKLEEDKQKEILEEALTNETTFESLPEEQKNILLHDLQIEAEKENEKVKFFESQSKNKQKDLLEEALTDETIFNALPADKKAEVEEEKKIVEKFNKKTPDKQKDLIKKAKAKKSKRTLGEIKDLPKKIMENLESRLEKLAEIKTKNTEIEKINSEAIAKLEGIKSAGKEKEGEVAKIFDKTVANIKGIKATVVNLSKEVDVLEQEIDNNIKKEKEIDNPVVEDEVALTDERKEALEKMLKELKEMGK